ncbi:hypothetical protein ACLVL5_06265 [Streptococcus pneumoniae]
MTVKNSDTIERLKDVWNHLDDATGELYSAISIATLTKAVPLELMNRLRRIDINEINSIAEEFENLVEAEGGSID